MKRIIFEGSPGNFKTSIIKDLAKNKNYTSTPEITHLDRLPPEDVIGTYDRSKEYFFIENEFLKYDLSKKSKKTLVLQDRDYSSIAAYNYARMKMFKEYERYNDVIKMISTVPKKMREDYILRIIILVRPDISINRKINTVQQTLWKNPKFLKYFNEYYKKNIIDNKSVFISGDKSYEYIYNKILSLIKKYASE
jgi:hypothetical protein